MIDIMNNCGGFVGLTLITPEIFQDNRGSFTEIYNKRDLEENGFNKFFVQDNEVRSKKGVLRGLHFQKEHPQGKLILVTKGEIFDVAVDIRRSSKTFGKWFGILLSEENRKQLYIPGGFAHGYLVLENETIVHYKCTEYYYPAKQCGIIWNDEDIKIKWKGLIYNSDHPNESKLKDESKIILSHKDINNMSFRNLFDKE